MIYLSTFESPVGKISLASNGAGLVNLWCETQKPSISMQDIIWKDDEILLEVKEWLKRYFAGDKPGNYELPLVMMGTEFRQEVWQLLSKIPYGQTVTYGDLAKRVAIKLGKTKMSAQAVGGAVGCNPIPIIVPCHRVVGANGKLVGYTGGLDLKTWLLHHEGIL